MNDNPFISWEAAVQWLRAQPEQKELVYACYYDQPLEQAASRYYYSAEWLAIRDLLPRCAGKVLDVGAGHGITSYALAKDGWQVTALEPYPSDEVGAGAIRRLAQGENLPIDVVQEFGEKIPFQDGCFDVVFARQALHHANDLPQFCTEIARVLKPGGRFVAIRDHVISHKTDLEKFLAIHPLHRYYGGENAFLLQEYKQAFASAGLILKQALRPLESAINFSPHDDVSLKKEFIGRIEKLPIGTLIGKILRSYPIIYRMALNSAARFDNRPGRVYSFVCDKRY